MNIYLDASATSPPREEVISKIKDIQSLAWGNPSSLHRHGIEAAEVLERSRIRIGRIFNASPEEIIFTSGATESIHLALLGYAKSVSPGRIIISAVEHPSVVAAAKSLEKLGWIVDICPVDNLGRIKLESLDKLIKDSTKIVSVVWGQSDVGTIQPIEKLGRYCRENGILFKI